MLQIQFNRWWELNVTYKQGNIKIVSVCFYPGTEGVLAGGYSGWREEMKKTQKEMI